MAFENLLRPGKINGMEMRNRFIAGPMEKAMANQDGTLTSGTSTTAVSGRKAASR